MKIGLLWVFNTKRLFTRKKRQDREGGIFLLDGTLIPGLQNP